VLPGLDAEAGVRALAAALGSPYGVTGAAWLPAEAAARIPELAGFGGPVALVRIEDFAASVSYRTARLRAELDEQTGEIFGDAATRGIWLAVRDAAPLQPEPEEAVWRVSVRPSAGPGVLRALAQGAGARGFLDWGGGLVWIAGAGSGENHAAVEQAARRAGGTWMLLRGPAPLRAAVDVIPREAPPLARITGRVKAALDPKGILNPGRMYAGV
jgi:glycolate oxidase FAD binding subunit